MKKYFRSLRQRIRTFVIDWSCSGMNWCGRAIIGPACDADLPEEALRLRFGRWLDDRFVDLFNLAYAGSDEEIEQALGGEIPPKYMSARQRIAAAQLIVTAAVHCVEPGCRWEGAHHETIAEECPRCRGTVFLDPYREPPRRLLLCYRGGAS